MVAESIDILAAWLWTFAVHGTLIGVLAAAVSAGCRRVPAREEWLWRYAILAGLVTATLQVAVIGAGFVPLHFEVHPVAEPIAVDGPPSVPVESGFVPSAMASPLALDVGLSAPDPFGSWSSIGAVGAAVLALLGLTRLGFRRHRLARVLRGRRRIEVDHPVHVALDALRARMGVRRRVRLTVRGGVGSPFACGVLRPEICLPEIALTMDPAWRDAMLAHELAHLTRRDPLWLDLGHALRALFPWQPMLTLAQRRLRQLAERRCDAMAARLVGALPVAECLVEVAGWMTLAERATARQVSAMAVEREGLRARVETLLEESLAEPAAARPLRVGAALACATALLTVTLPGASIAIEPATPTDRGSAPTAQAEIDRVPLPSLPGDPRTRRFVQLLGLLAEFDDERSDLDRRMLELQAMAKGRADGVDAELLSAIEGRLRAIDRLRARVADRARQLLVVPRDAAVSAATPSPSPSPDSSGLRSASNR